MTRAPSQSWRGCLSATVWTEAACTLEDASTFSVACLDGTGGHGSSHDVPLQDCCVDSTDDAKGGIRQLLLHSEGAVGGPSAATEASKLSGSCLEEG